MRTRSLLLSLTLELALPFSGWAAGSTARPAAALSEQAFSLLSARCQVCHGGAKDKGTAFHVSANIQQPFVIPGRPDDSLIWKMVASDYMPFSGAPLSRTEKDLLYRWIASVDSLAYAPNAGANARSWAGERELLAAIRDHLRGLRAQDRPFQRYLSLAHLHNDPGTSGDELRLYRAAVSKMLNSLSWKQQLILPRPVNPQQTLLGIDLRDFGWQEPDLWAELLKVYPYGLSYENSPDPQTQAAALEVREMTGQTVPFLRADWFVATAGRPPFYHKFLDLPEEVAELEKRLGVDFQSDFERGELLRGGFPNSGVSSQNRLVERHKSRYGAYWKSYDFLTNDGTGNLFQLPLGPLFDGSAFKDKAFVHAGGEMIFNLPNGLQGYFLANAEGRRIDEGPTAIVSDPLKTAGTPAIVSGISCMACHARGILPFKDRLGPASKHLGLAEAARLKLEQFHPDQKRIDVHIEEDQNRFTASLAAATRAFFKGAKDPASLAAEPVRLLVQRYLKDPTRQEVALELGVAEADLRSAAQSDAELQNRGLGILAAPEAAVKRTLLDSVKRIVSPFQEAALALNRGQVVAKGLPAFRPQDTVEFFLKTQVRRGSAIEADWHDPLGGVRPIRLNSDKEGELLVRYFLTPEKGKPWSAGEYRLEIRVDGVKQAERSFTILSR